MTAGSARRRLFFVGIPQAHVRPSIRRAQRLGYEVVLGDTAENLRRLHHLVEGADHLVVTDYTDRDSLRATASRLHAEAPLDVVVTFKETGAVPTAQVAAELGLRTNDPAALAACNDKARTHQLLRDAGFPFPRWQLCRDAAELRAFVAEAGPDVVVKPPDAAGSLGVRRLGPHDDAEEAFDTCRKAAGTQEVLVEQLLTGREVSVEAMLFRGRVVLFGVTQKHLFPGTFVESGHLTPDPGTELTPAGYVDVVARVTAALGLTTGPLHLEGFHTSAGFVPTEVHSRYGGDHIVGITEAAAGCDMTSPVFADLGGLPYEVTFAASRRAAGIRFLDVPPGTIRGIDGVEEASALPGVLAVGVERAVGDDVGPVTSSYDRVGWVTAAGADLEDVRTTLARAVGCVRVDVG